MCEQTTNITRAAVHRVCPHLNEACPPSSNEVSEQQKLFNPSAISMKKKVATIYWWYLKPAKGIKATGKYFEENR